MTNKPSLCLAVACSVALGTASSAAAASTAPRVTTGSATGITSTGATLNASVVPGSSATTVYVQYGTVANTGAFTGQQELGPGGKATKVAFPVTGLNPATKYYFRILAVSSVGATKGAEHAFTTAKIPLSLSVLTVSPNPTPYGGNIAVQGALAGTGNANQPVALMARGYPFTGPWVQIGNTVLTSATGAFAFTVTGAQDSTQFQVVPVTKQAVAPSPIATANVAAGLTAHVHHTRRRHVARFSGTVTPAENGAGVSVQKLEGARGYVTVAGTIVRGTRYAVKVRVRHRGLFRVLLTLTGAQTSAVSIPLIVG